MHLILWVVHDHITDWFQTGTWEGQKRHKSHFSTLYELGRPEHSQPPSKKIYFVLTGSLVTHLQDYTMTQMIVCVAFMFTVSQPIKKDFSHKTACIKPESPGTIWVLTMQNIFFVCLKPQGRVMLSWPMHYIFFLVISIHDLLNKQWKKILFLNANCTKHVPPTNQQWMTLGSILES